MGAAIAALGGIGERQEEAFVAAGERLQAQVAGHRKLHRLAGKVAHDMTFGHLAVALDQALAVENVGDAHHMFAGFLDRRFGDALVGDQRRVEQAVGIVECRAEQLSAGQILVGRRYAAFDLHVSGVDRYRVTEAWQRRAVGAQDEDRFDHVAPCLANC
ncbi:hypothetical protein D9M72_560690 [compost metagenome]